MTPDRWPAWRPISTAPRDGTEVLLWQPSKHRGYAIVGVYAVSLYGPKSEWVDCGEARPLDPTHWLPLPQAPEGGDG